MNKVSELLRRAEKTSQSFSSIRNICWEVWDRREANDIMIIMKPSDYSVK